MIREQRSVLVVEDTPLTQSIISKTLNRAGFNVEVVEDLESVRKAVRNAKFLAALVDKRIISTSSEEGGKRTKEDHGFHACTELREAQPDLFIVFYSSMWKHTVPDAARKTGTAAGADDVFPFQWFLENTAPEKWAKAINEGVAARRALLEKTRPLVVDPGILTQAILDDLRRETLRDLIAELIPNGGLDVVKRFGMGFSGALVFGVSTYRSPESLEKGEEPLRRTVLKVDRRRHYLEQELLRAPDVGAAVEWNSARPVRITEAPVDGWWGIISARVSGMSLRAWLSGRGWADGTRKALAKKVVKVHLKPALDQEFPAMSEETFNLSRGSLGRTYGALPELEKAAGEFGFPSQEDLTRIKLFLENRPGNPWPGLGSFSGEQHGDLHGENLRVDGDRNPIAIDWAHSVRLPRYFDLASLALDLILCTEEEDQNPWNVKASRDLLKSVRALFPFGNRTWPNCSTRLRVAAPLLEVSWSAFPDTHADARLPLASMFLFHLMRYFRFESIPMPRRCLAASLAGHLIGMDDFNPAGP